MPVGGTCMTIRTTARPKVFTAAIGIAAASAMVATQPSAGTAAAPPAPAKASSQPSTAQGYTPGSRDDALNAQLRKQLAQALKQKASGQRALATPWWRRPCTGLRKRLAGSVGHFVDGRATTLHSSGILGLIRWTFCNGFLTSKGSGAETTSVWVVVSSAFI